MNRLTVMFVAALLAAGLQTTRAQQNNAQAEKLLASAQHKATVDGDLKGAIQEYKKIVAGSGANRALAAQALVRMAECYQRLGDAESQNVYERIVREFSDQKEQVALARARLGGAARIETRSGITLRRVWDGKAPGSPNVTARGVDTAAVVTTISQDGRHLAYIPWASSNVNVHDLVTGADRPIAESYGGPSVISRDGTQVAYEWYGGEHSELRMVGIQGTGMPPFRRLYENADVQEITPMDFSPDGASIAVQLVRKDRTRQIGVVAVQSGALHVLKSVDWRGPTRLFFSPDGKDLAFDLPANDSSDQRDVFVLAVDGSREVPVVVHPSDDVVMGWSPDGRQILFASDRRGGAMGLWAQAFADRKVQRTPQLVKESIGSAWSMGVTSSGALYVNTPVGDRDIAVISIDLETGREVRPPVRPVQSFIGTTMQPAWSPDGSFLAYVSRRPIGTRYVLAIQSVETGEVRELRPSLAYFNQMSWAPDGRALVTGGTDLKGRDGIFRIDVYTGEVATIVLLPPPEDFANSYPQWSPDGKRIYYRRRIEALPGRTAAFIERDLASGQERELIRGDLGSISLSPDGRSIAAQRADPATKSQAVLLIPVAGGEPRELLHVSQPQRILSFAGMPWTPDGRGVLVRRRMAADSHELWLVPIAGEPRKLDIDVNKWATGNFGVISLHPDGRQIAFLTGQPNSEVWVLENFLPVPKLSR